MCANRNSLDTTFNMDYGGGGSSELKLQKNTDLDQRLKNDMDPIQKRCQRKPGFNRHGAT